MAIIVLHFLWLIGSTYLSIDHIQVIPLQSKLADIEQRLIDKSIHLDASKNSMASLESRYEHLKLRRDQPSLIAPYNQQKLIGSKLNFSWTYHSDIDRQRYILEIIGVNHGTHYQFNVISPGMTTMHIPIERVGYGSFLWRVTPGFRHDDVDVIQGVSSDFSLFTVYSTVWDKMLETRQIVVGVSPSMQGMFNYVSAKNEVVGFDIDLLHWVVSEINKMKDLHPPITISLVSLPWENLLPTLKSYSIDIIATSMTATRQREINFDVRFSQGFFATHEIFIAKNKPLIKFPLALSGRKVGAVSGTTGAASARYLSTLYQFTLEDHYLSWDDLYQDLEAGEIHFALADRINVIEDIQKSRFVYYGPNLDHILKNFYLDTFGSEVLMYAFAVHRERGNYLLEVINECLASEKGKNKILSLEDKWTNNKLNKSAGKIRDF